jgi:eukaryotic-like serine/threonine-protein kinase
MLGQRSPCLRHHHPSLNGVEAGRGSVGQRWCAPRMASTASRAGLVLDQQAYITLALAGRYRVKSELGRGGMAIVYLARDLRHDRDVAIKVLRAELAHVLGPERFLREIKLAARLQHPHILSVHDSGEIAGEARSQGSTTLWFTMPYVEGESLRERLKREGQLSVANAVQITHEAAQALDYAHEHSVIHRDIKPENILLTRDGNVLVADFGIARASGGEAGKQGSGEEERLTATGMSLGTPAYMSPEQAAGEQTVDARTDVYSLACVLYEMLAGEPPFTGPTAQAIIAKRFSTVATPVRVLRPDVPENIELALTTALARTPAGRYRSTGEFATALKTSPTRHKSDNRRVARLAAITIGVLLLAAVAWNLLDKERDSRLPSPDSRITRLAVLPFENLGDTADAYFAEGLSDEVRGKLAALSGLEVIARNSSGQYRQTTKPAQQIGKELGVQYILTGTVRWEKRSGASRVRVSPELVDAQSGAARWQAAFDAAITDVFQVQGEIAGRVVEALDLQIGAKEERALVAKPTENLEAYDAFLRGEAATRRFTTSEVSALRRGLVYYEQAVQLDSSFALAWTRVSRTRALLYFVSSSDPADSAAADVASRRALSLAPSLPDSRLASGMYYSLILGDNARALQEFQRGRELAPHDANLIAISAVPLQSLGHWEEALADAREAVRLDPRSTRTALRLARVFIVLRRYDDALDAADVGLRLDPAAPDGVWMKAMAYAAKGDLQEIHYLYRSTPPQLDRAALVAYVAHYWEMAWTLEPGDIDLLSRLSPEPFAGQRGDWGLALAQAWALKGDTARSKIYADSARLAYAEMSSRTPRNSQNISLLGLSLAYLGRYDDAVAAAKRSIAIRGVDRDKYTGGYNQLQLARVYAMAGRPSQAIETLAPLLKTPFFVTPGWLRIDPTFASLKSDPRFQRLVEGR